MQKVLLALDWEAGPVLAPSRGTEEAEHLRRVLGDAAVRWVSGAAEQSIAALQLRVHDALAPWPLIRMFAHHALTSTLLQLAGGDGLPAAAEAIDRELAEDIVARDIPFSTVTTALRVMQREWLSLLIGAALRLGPEGVGVVPALATSVAGTMDAWIGAATDAIVEERRRVDLAEQFRFRSTIESLMAAEPLDVESATRSLRVPLNCWHVGCAIGTLPGALADRRALEAIVQSFARTVGSERTVRYESSTGTVHLWVTSDRMPRTPRAEDLTVRAALLVGIGEPHPGAAGFRRTFLEASDALRLASCLGRNGVISYSDAALAIVLSQDEERAGWFVQHELRELGGDNPEMADMRATLRTFFDTRMRIAPAAERLFLHRNTLINRLERIQGLLGHGVAERSAETQAALVLAELFTQSPSGRPLPGNGS